MAAPTLVTLRRALADAGLAPASASPEASEGRADQAGIHPAELVEAGPLRAHPVGAPAEPDGPVAFLDGVQRWEPVATAGASPLVWAEVAAAVRERSGRRAETAVVRAEQLILGRPESLAAAGPALAGWTTLALSTEELPHPIGDLRAARAAIERRRAELERTVAREYRGRADGWLVIDGSIAEGADWASHPRTVGVIKSHASLPFGGGDLETYLRLPAGHRSSVFRPASRGWTPVHSWALRLWPWEGKDLLYGLIRVEVAPSDDVTARADAISRWLLAERTPLSTPDARWDRLLYGIHDVERFLRARRGVEGVSGKQ